MPEKTGPSEGDIEGGPCDGRSTLGEAEGAGEVAQSLVEIAAHDHERTQEDEKLLASVREQRPVTFYSDLIYTLAHIRYPEDEARLMWVNLLAHKAEMSASLGRNVGVRVAALDFFRNILGRLGEVKIIDSAEYVQTARLAVADGLTDLYNHRYFHDRLSREIERAREGDSPVSVLMMDIDHFKLYNDRNGHIAGDVALREVASSMRGAVHRDGVLARYGGEEFAGILPGLDKEGAVPAAERLRAAVEKLEVPNEEALPEGRLTISTGVSTFPEDASDRGMLVDRADLALYLAKTGGRNRVVAYPSERRRLQRFPAGTKVWYKAEGPCEEAPCEAALMDVGMGGLAMEGDDLPDPGKVAHLELWAPEKSVDIPLEGKVAWRRRGRSGKDLAGVEFMNLLPEAAKKLAEWLKGEKRQPENA